MPPVPIFLFDIGIDVQVPDLDPTQFRRVQDFLPESASNDAKKEFIKENRYIMATSDKQLAFDLLLDGKIVVYCLPDAKTCYLLDPTSVKLPLTFLRHELAHKFTRHHARELYEMPESERFDIFKKNTRRW